jgi:hypothetical protein
MEGIALTHSQDLRSVFQGPGRVSLAREYHFVPAETHDR